VSGDHGHGPSTPASAELESIKRPLAYGPVQGDLALVEEALAEASEIDSSPLAGMLSLVLTAGGKRLRPALVLLAGQFGSYPVRKLTLLAAAIELLHTASLVHDDVIDGAELRRGHPTVNTCYRNSTTVMLGDYLFAHSAYLVTQTDNIRVVSLFARTLMFMARGEIGQDMSAYSLSQEPISYLRHIGDKTASLFATATEGGSILAGCPQEHVAALRHYGYNLGMAFQIVDDILDFNGDEWELGKPAGSDLEQGTLTLPALLYLRRQPGENRISTFLAERHPEALAEAIAAVRGSGVLMEAQQVAQKYCRRALRALEILPPTPARHTLAELTDHVLQRQS